MDIPVGTVFVVEVNWLGFSHCCSLVCAARIRLLACNLVWYVRNQGSNQCTRFGVNHGLLELLLAPIIDYIYRFSSFVK